jgi:hypothetical protein
MHMSEQEEELSRRLHAARVARLSAQKTRLLALKRAEKLERELKQVAETGVKAQIYRTLAARAQLQETVKRRRVARYARITALGLMLCGATSGLAWIAMHDAVASGQSAHEPPLLGITSGDRLSLAYSYSVSLPATR